MKSEASYLTQVLISCSDSYSHIDGLYLMIILVYVPLSWLHGFEKISGVLSIVGACDDHSFSLHGRCGLGAATASGF